MKAAILEYLRNLTPQVLLFSLMLYLSLNLDLKKIDLSWMAIKNSFAFLVITSTFFLAFLCNLMNFVEQVINFSETMEIESYRAQKRGAGYLFKNLIPLVWKFDKLFLGKVAIVFVVLLAGTLVVFVSAIPPATALFNSVKSN